MALPFAPDDIAGGAPATLADVNPTTAPPVDTGFGSSGGFGVSVADEFDDSKFNGLVGSPEIWLNSSTGSAFVVYYVPNTEPPVPIMWEVGDEAELRSFFPAGQSVTYDKQLDQAGIDALGAIPQGSTKELVLLDGPDPMEALLDRFELEAQVRPWMTDPEVLALMTAAALEDRLPDDAEFESTEWWQTHTESERAWMLLDMSDPATAEQVRTDNYNSIADQMITAGIGNAPEWLIQLVADNFTTGVWTGDYVQRQIRGLSDPFSGVNIDGGILARLDPGILDQTQEHEDTARAIARRWLGPAFGALDDERVKHLAGRLRNDPDAQDQIEAEFAKQRLALFPNHQDAALTYEDIAAPWRQVFSQEWGQQADETSALFQKIVNSNDLETAQATLRSEGLKKGVSKVVADRNSAIAQAFGGV